MPRKKRVPMSKEQTTKPAEQGEVLDLTSAADFLKVSKPTFYRWLAQGRIKGFKAGTQWRFYRKDLQQFLESEEPSVLQVDADALRAAVERARKARGLQPVEWPEAETREESTVIGVASAIIADAIEAAASDIHLDKMQDEISIRYRIDGVLHEVMRLPCSAALPLLSRLKLMADMDLSERRLPTPQDGRIHINLKGRDYDLRLTTLPAFLGESISIRILDQSSVLIGLDRLRFSETMQAQLRRLLTSPMGVIVATGPAGSGKTTTLYSMMHEISKPHLKVLTIEDPVEYRIPNATQVHVNRKAGLTTTAALRTFMRSDPDILLVGEVLEPDTLRACVNAGLTGHLVLAQMHAEDASHAITRMLDMGLEPYLLASSLILVMAQRLVRRVCEHCKEAYEPPAELRSRVAEKTGLEVASASFAHGAGCTQCRQTGYRGRTGIYELLELIPLVREAITRPVPTEELRRIAVANGMTTMLRDGVEKAMQGITTIEEVMRVLAAL